MKCDENRPVCLNCSSSERQCSFRDSLAPPVLTSNPHSPLPPAFSGPASTFSSILSPLPAYPSTGANSSSIASSPASISAVIQLALSNSEAQSSSRLDHESPQTSTQSSPPSTLPPQGYDLAHLGLLHHLENLAMQPGNSDFLPDGQEAIDWLNNIFRWAMSSSYLMDEMLAVSALHLSTLASDEIERKKYLYQAARLETRALSTFNALRPAVGPDNCIPIFIFSGTLSIHTLFDASSLHHDYTQFLDKIIQFLSLHHGLRTITQKSWHIISQTELRHLVNIMPDEDPGESANSQTTGTELGFLPQLLAESSDSMGSSAASVCQDAVEKLQWIMRQRQKVRKTLHAHLVTAWPVLVQLEFLQMLRQRRPEALVVLAHWAVSIHLQRDFWVFGGSGRVLIESTSKYLGSYWDNWMAWPMAQLQADADEQGILD